MRLVCPNCGAQYEVPDEVIPEAGRDVQCSNCGNTWFQPNPDDDRDLAADLGRAEPDIEWQPETPQEAPPPATQDDDADAMPDTGDWNAGDDADDDDDADDTPPDPGPTPRRRTLSPDVADVLREEAAQEARARAGREQPLESQPDLGLQEPEELDEREKRARQARERMARMRGEPVARESAAAIASAGSSRRDLLPDIDEINSTLRSTSERRASAVEEAERAAEPDTSARQGGGFRRGFIFALFAFSIAALVYVYAPQIAEAVPATRPSLVVYVEAVNDLRAWVNDLVARALLWIDEMAGRSDA